MSEVIPSIFYKDRRERFDLFHDRIDLSITKNERFDRKTYDRILNPVAVSEIRGLVSSRGPVSLDKLFNKAALNVVWNFVSGTRYAYDDQRMHRLLGKEQYTLPRFVLYFLFLCKDILVYPELLKFIRVLTVSSKRILKSLVLYDNICKHILTSICVYIVFNYCLT